MHTASDKNAQDELVCLKIEPKTAATHTVIWLHGLGADGHDFAPMVPELNLPSSLAVRFIFPNAPVMPVSINNGYQMRAWYDIYSDELAAKIDIDGILKSVRSVQALIDAEAAAGIAANKIVLAGFSQGALIALAAGLSYAKPLAGVIALSGYLPAECLNPATADRSTPVFIAHGEHDPGVPFQAGEAAQRLVKNAGYPVAWHHYPIPHSVSMPEIQDISEWMQKVMA